MGKDRRKKDGNRKQADTSVPNDACSQPKAQREPRNRAPQEQRRTDTNKNTDSSVRDKISDHTTSQPDSKPDPPDTAQLFANLKRETDDIEALKAKKTPHRQIFSNWARYEEPLPGPDHEAELQGADFESLLQAPVPGHFQFKSERTWDANVTSLCGELFSLDVDMLADGLATIPLYQKLDLPISLFSAAELEDMDYYAKQCAVKFETTKSRSVRKSDKKEGLDSTAHHLLNILLLKEGSPVPSEEDRADKKTSLALNFDIEQPEVQNSVSEIETVNVDTVNSNSNTECVVKRIPETGSKPDLNKVTPPQKAGFSKTTLSSVQPNTTESEVQHDSTPVGEIDHEPKALNKMIPQAVTPKTEVVQSSETVKAEVTKQTVQQSDFEESLTEVVPEPVVPLGQRSSRCKSRGQTQSLEVQKVDSQKCQQTDDLDFLLSLKKPVKEAQVSSLKPSQVTKPTIEDDDDTAGPNSSQFPLMTPQKQTEDLEDWLDSMLDD